MNGVTATGGLAGGGMAVIPHVAQGGAQAQGNASAPVVAPGQPAGQAGQPGQTAPRPTTTVVVDPTQSPQEIRDQIRDGIRNAIDNGRDPQIIIPPGAMDGVVPQGAVDISIAMFVSIAFVIVGLPIARAMARRMDAGSQAQVSGGANLAPKIEQLQQSVDAMAIELERISEAQRFQSKLLAGREKEQVAARLER